MSSLNRTLLFCTTYSNGDPNGIYNWQRFRLWLRAIQQSEIDYDQILLVDDGSSVLPDWPDIHILNEADRFESRAKVVLYHFGERLGRHSATEFPGWVRSFFRPSAWAAANGFSRVVHIESDAFLISKAFQRHCNNISEGWVAPWCPRYRWPDSAVQIISGSALQSYCELSRRPVESWRPQVIEQALPFTHVETSFFGDRFGDYISYVPTDADWASQAVCIDERQREQFYWWLSL